MSHLGDEIVLPLGPAVGDGVLGGGLEGRLVLLRTLQG
jgi:hypothetical protein